MSSPQAFIAANRFGFGPRPGELTEIGRSPRRWVENQLRRPKRFPDPVRHLESTEEIAIRILAMAEGKDRNDDEVRREMRIAQRQVYLDESASRIRAAVETDTPFIERLVHFWSNHFTVSVSKNQIISLVGAYEREVIRPHVLGKFEDMLLASTRHPAMLLYLDNAQSLGPNSRAGRRSGRGLNENLAREILELHTLGVDGGYTQDDVIALAKIITGWSVERPRRGRGLVRAFNYRPIFH
ncbi:MAG: hypothetical protein Alpg2KO_22190 [Alphaproteobacteria bacterium]